MEDIVFIHSVDCRACVFELRNASKDKLKRLMQERRRCRKCQQCERLTVIENKAVVRVR